MWKLFEKLCLNNAENEISKKERKKNNVYLKLFVIFNNQRKLVLKSKERDKTKRFKILRHQIKGNKRKKMKRGNKENKR